VWGGGGGGCLFSGDESEWEERKQRESVEQFLKEGRLWRGRQRWYLQENGS
jgi:hypothetical protein